MQESVVLNQLTKLSLSTSPKDQEATFSTLRRIFDNISQHPNVDKYRQIKLTGKTFSSKVWQYPAGEELMKMSGWVVEDDHVRLRDDSCVQIVSQLLKSFLSSSAAGVVPSFPDNEFQVLIKAFYNGDVPCIQKLLKVSHISPNGRIYSESGSSLNLLEAATIAQHIDIVKLLLTDYSMDPYVISLSDDMSLLYIESIFCLAPQSFIIAIMKYCGVKSDFKTKKGYSLLHYAVTSNCFDVVCFLLEECSDIDVNATDDILRTPLHLAYLHRHIQIAQYLIEHGADEYAMDSDGHTPYEYIDGRRSYVMISEYLQNRRKIHHIPFSIEHCYYMKLANLGNDDNEAVYLTMEQFPSLKEDGPTQPHHDIDALKEFTQLITTSIQRSTSDSIMMGQPPSEVQEGHVKTSADYLRKRRLSVLKRAQVYSS